jgi:energy-coupling factor transport system ATP-binding protein
LAAILVAEPEIIVLDEPTRGLDYHNKELLVDFLRVMQRQGKTILLVTHDVELVASCADRVVLLSEGQVVVDGPTRKVLTESVIFASQISKLFGGMFLTVADVLEAVRNDE